ncbi:hypothetical protein L9F63_022337 [Diploptera punctata]|uniref:Receptor-binding cancer antigen expressed on SiSo cells n=1 Tax=Diploptera punctata TaxID=6984 RepID=A0AAD7ZMU8_DIPPU|nr:hypothetical protein L9F63_022337 [Diploptera punctata]
MAFLFVVNRVRALFMIILGIIKRGLCCFRRRRRASADPVPLIAVGVVPNNDTADCGVGQDIQNWNSWDDSPVSIVTEQSPENSVEKQIELYRQRAVRHQSESEEQPQPDFFEDMTPHITRQQKVLVRDQEHEAVWQESVSSHLELSMDPVLYNSPDLETWEETPGWEDQAQEDWDPDTVLKEKRHLERQRRLAEQQQKRQRREQLKMSRPIALGAKLS